MLCMGCQRAAGGEVLPLPVETLPLVTAAPLPTATRSPVTPTPPPTRVPPASTGISYTVQLGDTLTGIAAQYGTTVDALLRINGIANPDQLKVGQILQITMRADLVGPGDVLLPDSEVVYGPSYADFEMAAGEYTGLFATYSEEVNGVVLTGREIVQQVAEQYSVGPRVLLTLLELRGGWLTNPEPSPQKEKYPLGYTALDYWDGLHNQLILAANALNAGFYGWWLDEMWLIQTEDGQYIQFSPELNAGTAGVQRALSAGAADYEAWVADLRRFPTVYRMLFGDPFVYTVDPLLPPDLEAPELELPWPKAEAWYFTGGPHGGWGSLGAWAALDFATREHNLGCTTSRYWATAAASGTVLISRVGEVQMELDSDGFLGTGWVLLYMHLATDGRVAAGTRVAVGARMGHPSCEGGVSNASHLHIARRYNGVWIPAHDPRWPMELSGWIPQSTGTAYDGTLVKGTQVRTACECWEAMNNIWHNP
ncbi:MAG: LysM peptidoglycan-binding domain-containing protein [Anaerolineae bacterium]|nr:LysM peptidoglycan-binding domain-containing protein [Anaerolineae bacterium]